MTPTDPPPPPLSGATAPDLVSLVGSRIAHDLNNPIGAIANGLELLGMAGLADGPELGLIAESVENARRRIKAFRIAFGAAAPDQSVAANEIAELCAPAADRRRLEIDWPITGDVPRSQAKRVFLALMCLESAMPWGGLAGVRPVTNGWRIEASAPRLRIDQGLWSMLEGGPAPPSLTAGTVHFALLAGETAGHGSPVALHLSDTTIALVV